MAYLLLESLQDDSASLRKVLSGVGSEVDRPGIYWITGETSDGEATVSLKVFSKPSIHGINGGRISQLSIRSVPGLKTLVNYDRGWDVRPMGAMQALVKRIVASVRGWVDPADVDPKTKLEESAFFNIPEGMDEDEPPALAEDANIGRTILSQLGGTQRLAMMTGAKDFLLLGNGVQFGIGKNKSGANKVRITLTPQDEYDVELWKMQGLDMWKVKLVPGVQAGNLKETIENLTGLYLSL